MSLVFWRFMTLLLTVATVAILIFQPQVEARLTELGDGEYRRLLVGLVVLVLLLVSILGTEVSGRGQSRS